MIKPRIAIINSNTLEAMGLKAIIDEIIPMAEVGVYDSLDELNGEADTAGFFHFFVSAQALFESMSFFLERQRQTVVLVNGPNTNVQSAHFHTLNTSLSQHALIKQILQLHEIGHGHPGKPGKSHSDRLCESPEIGIPDISPRETEVLALVVKGFINREIADRLNISLPTVITHRKNICEKLNLRSVSSLTIYAVTHGIVRVEDI